MESGWKKHLIGQVKMNLKGKQRESANIHLLNCEKTQDITSESEGAVLWSECLCPTLNSSVELLTPKVWN